MAKRLQCVPWILNYGQAFPFINLMKSASSWSSGGAKHLPNLLNSDGYPTSLPSGSASTGMFLPTQDERPGNYIVRATGDGVLRADLGAIIVGGSGTSSGGSVEAVIDYTGSIAGDGTSWFRLNIDSTGGANGVLRDIVVMHVDDEARYDSGIRTGVRFEERIQEVGIDVLRMLDWWVSNTSQICHVSELSPESYYTYATRQPIPGTIATGTATKSGTAYAATVSGVSSLVNGQKCLVLLAHDVADGDTFNLNSLGAKPIKTLVGGLIATHPWWGASAGTRAYFIYDQLFDAWRVVADAGDEYGTDRGVALAAIVDMCNYLGVHPWVHIPQHACDFYVSGQPRACPFATDLGTYLRDNLESDLIPRYELWNEVWNWGFYQPHYALRCEWVRGYANRGDSYEDVYEWYARAASKMGRALDAVYSGDRSKYRAMASFQTSGNGTIYEAPRIVAARFVAETGSSTDAGYNWLNAGAIANYWYNALPFSQELANALEYTTASDARKAELVDEAATTTTTKAATGDSRYPLGRSNSASYAAWKTMLAGYGINEVHGYEGGLSMDTFSSDLSCPWGGVTAITKATQAVVTVGHSNWMPCAGITATFNGIGGMTQLNGNTYTVVSINEATLSFTVNVNSTGFGTYTSGGEVIYPNTRIPWNTYRNAQKYAPRIVQQELQDLHAFIDAGGTRPSIYCLSGPGPATPGGEAAWTALVPSIYAADSPRWKAFKLFAQGKRRLRLQG